MIVVALRHADRVKDKDLLKPEGVVRAKLLARMLAEIRITTAFCSTAQRARDTLQPLQEALGNKLKVDFVPQDDDHESYIIAAVEKALPAGTTALVISHSDSVVAIVKGLTGQTVDEIEDPQFDKLFVLSVTAPGTGTVALLRYGAPTPPPP
jgi:phosphohistidine phosphatase SixA